MGRKAAVILVSGVAIGLLAGAFSLAADPKPVQPMPPIKVRLAGGEWGSTPFTWEGVTVVADPINKETLYLCGRNGGAESGSIGSWALAEDGKTWRELKLASALLDPLREKCQAARGPTRDGANTARVLRYSGLPADKLSEAVKAGPARQIADALKLAAGAAGAVAQAKGDGSEADAIAHARPLTEKAVAGLKTASESLADGKLDAGILAGCFAAAWTLDEAVACLSASPTDRYGASGAYDPLNKCVVLFGGSHGDYVQAETWIYDCAGKAFRQTWPKAAPTPRVDAKLAWDEGRKTLVLTGGRTVLAKMVYQEGYTPLPADEWTFDAAKATWTPAGLSAQTQPAAGAIRKYRTVCPAYDPRWYDGAPAPDAAATAARLDKLAPNTWTEVPIQARPAPERDWGTAAYSPDHDQIFRWTGGHQADPGNNVSTYFPAVDRWAIGYVPEIYGKGMSFSGRPDCLNHTYLHYAYDPLSKRLVCASAGGTGVYDPARMDWDCSVAQPFNHHIYETCTVGTPIGVVVITPGYFGVMDVAKHEWRKLPVTGKLPRTTTDGTAVAYDSKRDAIWIASFAGYQKPSGNIWKYDLKTGHASQSDPANADTIGKAKGFSSEMRECVYLPDADLVLFNNFVADRQVAYDPAANRWVLTSIAKTSKYLGTVSVGLVRDKRGLLWAMGNYQQIAVLKLDAKALTVTTEVPR